LCRRGDKGSNLGFKPSLRNVDASTTSGLHLAGDGALIFKHACRMGLEGIVLKRRDVPTVRDWINVKTPARWRPGSRRATGEGIWEAHVL